MTTIYVVFFITWLVMTIFWQFEAARNRMGIMRYFNVLNILPIWTFFAPRPGISDTHLLFRDKDGDGKISGWTEIPVFEYRRFYHFIWNPLKRNNKLIVDSLSQIKNLKRIGKTKNVDETTFQDHVKISKGYLILLSAVMGYDKLMDTARSRQFIIAETSFLDSTRKCTPILSSPFHKI